MSDRNVEVFTLPWPLSTFCRSRHYTPANTVMGLERLFEKLQGGRPVPVGQAAALGFSTKMVGPAWTHPVLDFRGKRAKASTAGRLASPL